MQSVAERNASIVDMYRRGLSYRDIAYFCDCSISVCYKVMSYHQDVKRIIICKQCGQPFEYRKNGPIPEVCENPECHEEWNRKKQRNRARKVRTEERRMEKIIPEGPNGKIRPYTDASDMMIRWDLDKGWSIMDMAIEYGRSPKDLKRHIKEAGLRDDKRGVKRLPISKKRDRAIGH